MGNAVQNTSEYNKTPLGARLGEGIFCIIYLVFMVVLIFLMNTRYESAKASENLIDIYRFGMGTLLVALLVGGDAFHLIPRIIIDFRGSMPKQDFFLGLGSMISSLTMTIFYNILITMGDSMEYNPDMYNYDIENTILVLTGIRILLVILPQNKWFENKPNRKWAKIRNVPFALIGLLTVFGLINVIHHAVNYPASFYVIIMITVILSFLFYLPVAILSKEKPKLGMLMIPKTICYMVMLGVICFY